MGVKIFLHANKKALLIMITIILITTITCVSAVDENTTIHKNKTITKNIQQTTKTENNQIYLNQDNYQEYKNYEYPENTQIIINDTINDAEFNIYNKNISITGNEGATLSNSHIEVFDDGSIRLSNITFTTNDESKYTQVLMIETDNNILENLKFNEYRSTADRREYYRSINLYGDNNTIINCTFDVTQPSKHINWDTFSAECPFETIAIHGNKNNISNNSLFIQEGEEKDYPFGTIFAISVRGDNNTIDSNNILMQGTLYLYGVRIYQSNNTVSNNNIEVNSIRYANGIAIESPQSGVTGNNKLVNNTVHVTTQNSTIPGEPSSPGLVDAAYAIMITEYKYTGGGLYTGEKSNTIDNIIEGNTITGESSQMYAIELFGGKGTTISSNNIRSVGVSAMGIAGGGAGTKIIGNRMEVYGQTNQTFYSADYYKPQTGGINLQYGTGTTITGNVIITDNGPAIRSLGEGDTLISDNIIDVNNNEVAIDINGPRGLTDIIGNAITNLADQIINGGSASGNFDPNLIPTDPEPVNPGTDETNKTETPENGTETPENSTVTPEQNDTETPVINETEVPENRTEVPEQNDTETPVINETEVPENRTEVPENSTEIPEPEENQTVVPEPEPQQNQTEIPQPEVEENTTEIPVIEEEQNKTQEDNKEEQKDQESEENKEEQKDQESEENNTNTETEKNETTDTTTNTTTIPDIIIENTTVTPTKNSTQPAQGELVEDMEVINGTQQVVNDTTSAGEKPDDSKDSDDSTEPVEPQQPQQPESQESENSESEDTSNQESKPNQEEQQSSSAGQDNAVATTATIDSSKVYEITQKLPDDLMPEHPEIIIVLLLTLCAAFTYGYLKKR